MGHYSESFDNHYDKLSKNMGSLTSAIADKLEEESYTLNIPEYHPSVTQESNGEVLFKPDMVNHPPHYNKGKIECIDAIESAIIGLSGAEAYYTGNIIKYAWRWKDKGGKEDLEKAKKYLQKLIDYETPEGI